MRCPATDCDGQTHRVIRTRRGHASDSRKCICDTRQRIFETVTKATVVRERGTGREVPVRELRRGTASLRDTRGEGSAAA